MSPLVRFALLALILAGYSSCCCCGDFTPPSSSRHRHKSPRRSPMACARQLPVQSASDVKVLWNSPFPAQVVQVASLRTPATDERSALQLLKQQAGKLGANALTDIQIASGIMSCEAVLLTP